MSWSAEDEFNAKKLRLNAIEESEFRSASGVSLEEDADWPAARQAVLARDADTCWFCGFKYPKYMEVHHREGKWDDNSPENLVTLCPLCHSCLHIGLAGIQERGKLLVLKRSCDQAGLNRYILDTIVKYGPASPAAVTEILKTLPVLQELDSMSLVMLANKIVKEKSNKRRVPRPIDDKFIFFPNIMAFNIVRYIIKNHRGTEGAKGHNGG